MDDNKFNFENCNENKKEEYLDDSQNGENIQESKKEDGKSTHAEEKANEEEEKTFGEKERSDKEKDKGDINTKGSFSANYQPPYYIPNFTFYGAEQPNRDAEKKEKKTVGIGVMVAVCAICIVLSSIIGAIAGAVAGSNVQLGRNDGDIVTVTKSDRQINVQEVLGSTGAENLSVAQVAALVGESVVEITTTHVETSPFYGQYITSGAGSGVIFSQNEQCADIVTNYHVISGASEIRVRVKKGDSYLEYAATLISGDAIEDIAIIRIFPEEETELSVAVFVSDSDDLIVGEQVVAIGNPLGHLGGTVTDGIISALDREITIGDNVMTLLQTNVAINPGNSGGGLFNMAGELIGIVNAKQSSTGIEGLGFAIPANIVRKDIIDLIEYGYIKGRVTLGISVQSPSMNGVSGVFVSNSGNTQLKSMDRIVRIGDVDINTIADLKSALKKYFPGDVVELQIVRAGEMLVISVTAYEEVPQR